MFFQVSASEREGRQSYSNGFWREGREGISKGHIFTLSGFNTEGVVYTVDCKTHHREVILQEYVGETSGSAFQRGKKNLRDKAEGVLAHPIV